MAFEDSKFSRAFHRFFEGHLPGQTFYRGKPLCEWNPHERSIWGSVVNAPARPNIACRQCTRPILHRFYLVYQYNSCCHSINSKFQIIGFSEKPARDANWISQPAMKDPAARLFLSTPFLQCLSTQRQSGNCPAAC